MAVFDPNGPWPIKLAGSVALGEDAGQETGDEFLERLGYPVPFSLASDGVDYVGNVQTQDLWAKTAGPRSPERRSSQLLSLLVGFSIALAACSSTRVANPSLSIPAPGTSTLDVTPDAVGQAVQGGSDRGRIVYGLSAPATGLLPTETGCDVSCRQILNAIADPLVSVDDDGDVVPMLLSSIEPADDYFTWILTLREGIVFHDGSVLDGAALDEHFRQCRQSPLTSAWFAPIGATEASGHTLTLHLEEPWLPFPELLATHPCSYVVKGGAMAPIGTGPFRVADPSIGTEQAVTGHGLRTIRFEQYWRGTAGTGEGLPLLDAIEFTVQPDSDDRARLLAGGAIDLYHVDDAAPAEAVVSSTLGTDTYGLVFNLGAHTGVRAAAASSQCRDALAAATERSQFVADPSREATGPFGPGQIGFVERLALDTPDDPTALVESCLATSGGALSIELLHGGDAATSRIAASLKDQWADASNGLISVTIETLAPADVARRALLGDYEVLLWRSNGGIHPEASFPWWHSSSVRPVGEASLNVGRLENAEIDQALKALRVDPLPLAQQFAAEEITRSFNRTNATIWLEWTTWSVLASPRLGGFDEQTSPDGARLAPMVAGAQPVHGITCAPASC